MNNFRIVIDSACDLPDRLARAMDISVVPLTFRIDNHEYINYLDWREIAPQVFFSMLKNGHFSQTAAPGIDAFIRAMEPALSAGEDVLYLGFTSNLSATFNSGRMAAEILEEKYPQRKILVVDTMCGGMGQGLLCYLVWMKKRHGCTIEEAVEYAEQIRGHVCHWITLSDLKFVRRGGRISAGAALFGTILNVQPILHLDKKNELSVVSKVRTKKALLTYFADKFTETAISPEKQVVFISYSGSDETAQALRARLRQCGATKFVLNSFGPVIGGHAGPDATALFFIGDSR